MPFAEQSRAVGTEAYPPLEGEDAPVGLVLIDEDLQSGVDDLDLPAHAGEPPCALDEVVPQVDYCPCHDIELAAGDIIVNVGPSGREASTAPTISATFGGVARSAVLTVNPVPAAPTLSTLTVNPTSVVGGAGSTGTVTLTAAAGTGGAIVTLSSSNTTVATAPASVTVLAGTLSANFSISTTAATAATPVTIAGTFGGVTQTATLTVNAPAPPPSPPPPAQSATVTVTATGRTGERVTSTPAGISVAVGSTGSATFTTGTSVTLTVSNGRGAIWSGACSSGGNKVNTCRFTVTGGASVSANVQ